MMMIKQLIRSAAGRSVRCLRAGTGDRRVLILGGVHGSERSGIWVAEAVAGSLHRVPPVGAEVAVIPCLFPDNAALGLREAAVPTNRNFPPPGAGPDPLNDHPTDMLDRPILPENLALITWLARFKPEVIVSVHATVNPPLAGIFADPHPGNVIRTRHDAALAVKMAHHAAAHGARVPGNDLDGDANPIWGGDVADGASLGLWGPVAIPSGRYARPAAGVITVEITGLERPEEVVDSRGRHRELSAFKDAIIEVALAPDATDTHPA